MSLTEKLKAASEKASLREFEVRITETLQKTVVVEARDRQEAKDIVSNNWKNSEYILDADDFAGVKFETLYASRDKALTPER